MPIHPSKVLAPVALALSLAWPMAGFAQVTYQFHGSWGDLTQAYHERFTLTLPDYLAEDTRIDLGALTTCHSDIRQCSAVHFVLADPNAPRQAILGFQAEYVTTNYYFAAGAFQRPGLHEALSTTTGVLATLDVTGPPVPEPGTAALWMAGLVALVLGRSPAILARSRASGRHPG